MEKILAVCAAALVAGVASADITSQVVGYSTKDLVKGQQVITGVQFKNVGADTMDLQTITMGNVNDGEAMISWWDPVAGSFTKAYWYNALYDADGKEISPTKSGWGDGDNWVEIPKTFASGEGFWIQPAGEGATITIAGEVLSDASAPTAAIALTKSQQVQLTSPYPVGDLDLQTITMGNVNDGEAMISWWDPVAGSFTKAYWYNALYDANGKEISPTKSGWGDGDNWVEIPKTFAPGEGFWIQPAGEGATINFANPFYVAE